MSGNRSWAGTSALFNVPKRIAIFRPRHVEKLQVKHVNWSKTGIQNQKDRHVQATYLLRTVAHPELYKMARSALRPSATQLQTGLCCCRTSNISLVAVSMHRSRRIAECGQRNCSWSIQSIIDLKTRYYQTKRSACLPDLTAVSRCTSSSGNDRWWRHLLKCRTRPTISSTTSTVTFLAA